MFRIAVLFSTLACAVWASSPDVILPQLDGRIIGGENTTIEALPWQGSLQYRFQHLCGCSIISEKFIISAAHCFPKQLQITGYWVRVGSTYRYSGGRLHSVKSVTIHEGYNTITIENDIAVAELFTPVVFSPQVQPITLSRSTPSHGAEALVSGWGYTKPGVSSSSPDVLQCATVYAVENSICKSATYGYGSAVKGCMLCAMDANKDSCQGDSGGPLVSGGKLVGIVSWGYGCASPLHPGVYTNVPCYADWVNRVIGK